MAGYNTAVQKAARPIGADYAQPQVWSFYDGGFLVVLVLMMHFDDRVFFTFFQEKTIFSARYHGPYC